jgi:hypothetical protein
VLVVASTQPRRSAVEQTKGEAVSNVSGMKKHTGTCHCGAVRYEVEMDLGAGVGRCNCSICTKVAQTGGIVKPEAFKLLAGEESLSEYVWGAKISKRKFCKHCGIHCFGFGHLAELGGDYVSVNVNTLEGVELRNLKVIYWDGRHNNWHAGPRDTAWPIMG